MVETLQDKRLTDKQVALDFLTRINGEVGPPDTMVTELTELSHIETGKADWEEYRPNLNYLIEEVVGQMRPQAESKPVTITTDFNSNLPVYQVDKDRIRQTLTNLVHNAINLIIRRKGYNYYDFRQRVCHVSMSDTGIGISKKITTYFWAFL